MAGTSCHVNMRIRDGRVSDFSRNARGSQGHSHYIISRCKLTLLFKKNAILFLYTFHLRVSKEIVNSCMFISVCNQPLKHITCRYRANFMDQLAIIQVGFACN